MEDVGAYVIMRLARTPPVAVGPRPHAGGALPLLPRPLRPSGSVLHQVRHLTTGA
jgi:hypothetical protein